MADPADGFDAASRFITISGRGGDKRYFPVQARIDLFRHESPDGIVEQELVQLDDRLAMFKTTVTRIIDGEVRGRADGYGMEFAKDFPDYILKAATVSLGRALNALGFGGSDLDEGVEAGNLADAPVDRSAGRGGAPTPLAERRTTNAGPVASERQVNYIRALGKERGLVRFDDGDGREHADDEAIVRAINQAFGLRVHTLAAIANADARTVLDRWAPPKDGPQANREPAPAADPETGEVIVSWTVAWKRLRELGCQSQMHWIELPGRAFPADDPQAAIDLYERAKEARDRAIDGTAGSDKYTQ